MNSATLSRLDSICQTAERPGANRAETDVVIDLAIEAVVYRCIAAPVFAQPWPPGKGAVA